MNSKVSLVKSQNSFEGVLEALNPFKKELEKAVLDKKQLLIKVNFVSTSNSLAATPSKAVEAILEFLAPIYKEKILIAEGATLGTTPEGFKNYGYLPLKEKYNIEFVDLNKDKTRPVEIFDKNGQPFKIPLCQAVEKSDFIISVCRPKTHDTVVVTLSLKNLLVGSILKRGQIHQGKIIHQNLLKLTKIIKPSFSVIDGTVGMEGDGPVFGTEIKSGWVAAGFDWLTVDSLATWLMGFDIKNVGYLYLASQEGLGNIYPGKKVKIIGEAPKNLRKNFKPHSTYLEQIKWR